MMDMDHRCDWCHSLVLVYTLVIISRSSHSFMSTQRMIIICMSTCENQTGLPVFIVLVSILTLPHLVEKFLQCLLGTLNVTVAERDNDDVYSPCHAHHMVHAVLICHRHNYWIV